MDETYTRANEQLAEVRVLLDLTAERLWDLQRDFAVLQDEMVKAYAMLGTLAAPVELQQCQEAGCRYLGRSDVGVGDPARKRARASNRPPVTPRSDKLDAVSWITETGQLLTAVGVGSSLGSLIMAQLGGPAVMIRGGSRRVWCHSVRRGLGGCR